MHVRKHEESLAYKLLCASRCRPPLAPISFPFVPFASFLPRSCAMIRPDLRPICENMLMAEGFVKARALAVKFVTLYSLSSELLSKQVMDALFDRCILVVLADSNSLKDGAPYRNFALVDAWIFVVYLGHGIVHRIGVFNISHVKYWEMV